MAKFLEAVFSRVSTACAERRLISKFTGLSRLNLPLDDLFECSSGLCFEALECCGTPLIVDSAGSGRFPARGLAWAVVEE